LRQILNSDPQDPEKGVPLRPARAATIALQVLDGLDYLAEFKYKVTNQAEDGQVVEKEAKGIIHRDLKPENILIDDSRSPSDRGYIKIVDMGLAREVAVSTLTATGFGMGTPVYMAPEQVEGRRDLDPRTDLFAAGTIIYEMLTGRTLFSGMERLDKKVDELVKKAQGIPDELKPTLTGVLRYERNYRPARAVLRKAIMKLWEQEEQTTQKAG
jgi:serine/threonine protein kinase